MHAPSKALGPLLQPLSFAVQNPLPAPEKALYNFAEAGDLAKWSLYSDAFLGGSTTAGLKSAVDSKTQARKVAHHVRALWCVRAPVQAQI